MTGPAPLVVVGLGPAGPELMSVAARDALSGALTAFLRTDRHPGAAGFEGRTTFDHLYETADSFDQVYRGIVEALVAAAQAEAEVGRPAPVYAVPGSPLVAERTVELLRADPRVALQVVPGLSFLDLAWAAVGIDPLTAGVRLVDGTRFAEAAAGERGPLLVAQCWSSAVLSEIKLSLDGTEAPDRPPVIVLHHLGLPDQEVRELPWDELDRQVRPDHLTSLYIPALADPVGAELVALDELVHVLRARCPWDQAQTHASLRRHLLEESYEVLDAIDALVTAEATADRADRSPSADRPTDPRADLGGAVEHLEEELGDLLFQVYFHACLAAEEGRFTLADVARQVRRKLIGRHPHVFADVVADSPDAVAANWEVIKAQEKGRTSVTEGIPTGQPALALAAQLQKKAAAAPGWTPPRSAQVVAVVTAGLAELDPTQATPGDADRVGQMLWALTDLARRADVDPEEALRRAALAFAEQVRAAERAAGGSPDTGGGHELTLGRRSLAREGAEGATV